ncbi:hypothetical protein [Clostridium sp.]|uniref:hypothetical protein n=1 Tax=Clostridium sp. TaxID=1506 RepID=UPI0039F4BA98
MKESNKKESNKTLFTLLPFVIGAILMGSAVFFGTYYFFIGKSQASYVSKIKTEINNINKVNESSYIFTKGQTIDINKISSSLSQSIASLQNSHSKIRSLIVTNKYAKDQNNLILGLENNILMYKHILSIVSDPKSPNLTKLLDELEKSRDDCMNYYALVSIKGIKITLPNESLEFLNNTIAYTEKQIRQNTDAQIVLSQNRDFLLTFNDISNQFSQIKKDYMNTIIHSRSNVTGYENLLSELDNTENAITRIKIDLSNLTIPNDALSVYEAFVKVLDDYDTYIQSLKYSVKTEQLTSVSGLTNNNNLNKLYDTPEQQMQVVEKDYRNFIRIYNEFEDKIV